MKHYYGCPIETITLGNRVYRRPILAHAVDANGGVWKLCWDGPHTHLVVIHDLGHAAVLPAVRAIPGVNFVGNTPRQARQHYSDLTDQEVGGE